MKLVTQDLAAREILAAARYYRDAARPRFRKALVDEIGRAFERVLATCGGSARVFGLGARFARSPSREAATN